MMKDDVLKTNEFVRAEQKKMRGMMGDRPKKDPECYKFNAYMSNEGENAQEYARKEIHLDDAFPVK